MDKLQFLAQFLVDLLAHLVEPSFTFIQCKIAAFAYNMIDVFVSISTQPTAADLLRLIYYCFDIVGPYGVILCCSLKRFSFSLNVSLSLPRPRFLV